MKLPEKRKFQVNLKEGKKISSDQNYKLVYISVACFFICSGLIFYYAYMTIISLIWSIRIFLICVALAYIAQIILLKTIYEMKRMEYMMLSLFAGAPILMSTFLMLNYHIHTSERTDVYELINVRHIGKYQYFDVNDIPCENHPELCVVHEDDLNLNNKRFIKITLAKGLFGFELISEMNDIDESP